MHASYTIIFLQEIDDTKTIYCNETYCSIKVKQSHYRSGQALRGFKRLRLPDFKTSST